jgi:hypothetical protein
MTPRSRTIRSSRPTGQDPAQAKVEIAKHLDGDLTLRPLPATGRERRAEIRGRAKLNSLLEGQEARGLDLNQRPLGYEFP